MVRQHLGPQSEEWQDQAFSVTTLLVLVFQAATPAGFVWSSEEAGPGRRMALAVAKVGALRSYLKSYLNSYLKRYLKSYLKSYMKSYLKRYLKSYLKKLSPYVG